MKVYVEGIGLVGPGLSGWSGSKPALCGSIPYTEAAVTIPPNELLPPAERRRTGLPVRVALAVGHEAVLHAQRNAAELPAIFASSQGDGDNMHHIFEILANNGHEVSPTRFHNSVHNAPSGYWSIATKSMEASTSIACYDESFVAGLIETVTQIGDSRKTSILLAYDSPYPAPLEEHRPIKSTFGVALILAPEKTGRCLAELDVGLPEQGSGNTSCTDLGLEALRLNNPAARSLPLLSAIASGNATRLELAYVADNHIGISVQPC